MARLIKVIDDWTLSAVSQMPYGHSALYTITSWHWQLIDTTPAEVAYFNTLGDNE